MSILIKADCNLEAFSTKETDAMICTRVERGGTPRHSGHRYNSYICPCKQRLPYTYESQVVWPAQLGPTRVEYVRALAPPAAEYSCAVASQFTFTFMRGESFASQAHSRAPLPQRSATCEAQVNLLDSADGHPVHVLRTRMCHAMSRQWQDVVRVFPRGRVCMRRPSSSSPSHP